MVWVIVHSYYIIIGLEERISNKKSEIELFGCGGGNGMAHWYDLTHSGMLLLLIGCE